MPDWKLRSWRSTAPHASRRGVAAAYACAALALLAVVVPPSLRLIGRPFTGFLAWDNGVLVALHRESWTGARAGLPLNGGVIVEIDGMPFESGRTLRDHRAASPLERPLRLLVRSRGRTAEYLVPGMRLSASDYMLTFGIYLLNAAALMLVGFLALWLRPDLAATRALAWSTGALGALLVLTVDYVTACRLVALCRTAEALAPAALLNLALVFPTERAPARRRLAAVALAAAAVCAAQLYASLSFRERPADARWTAEVIYVLIALALLGLVLNYATTLLRHQDPARRAQAAVVFAGGLPAFAMTAFGMLAFTLLEWSFSWSWVFLLLPLAPISMLYAMVRQDLFDAERVVRLSAGYFIACAAVLLAYGAGLAGLDWLVLGLSESRGAPFLLLLMIALLFDPLRRRVQAAVDRAFYRSRIDPAHALEQSSAGLLDLKLEQEIAAYVGVCVREALALEHAELRTSCDRQPEDVVCQDVELAGQRLAVIACGPKRSGAPFSPDELELVRGIAHQAALAIHNVRTTNRLVEAERMLRVKDRLAVVGEFAGAVAHGIRNPLFAIRAATQVAQQKGRPEEEAARSLELVLGETDRLERRIRSLLHFSRPHDLERRETSLVRLLHQVAAVVTEHGASVGVKLSLDVPGEDVTWSVDQNALFEALLELATNALRAMPEGGRITLGLAREPQGVALWVADTGHGVTEEERSRVFDLFYTTRHEGTGVGLASVKKIVEAHGGRITVTSSDQGSPTLGAVFTIHLGASK